MYKEEWRRLERHTEREPQRWDDEESSGLSSEELEERQELAAREADKKITELQAKITQEEPRSSVLDLPLENREPEKPNVFQRAYQSVKQSKFAKMLMIAAGLHAPMTPQGQAIIDRVVHGESRFGSDWFKKNTVIHPQSDEQKTEVRTKIHEREKHVDKKAVTEYEKKTSEQLERGEHVSFKRMYFDLERLHGVPAEEVVEAERKVDSMILKYANEVGTSLEKQEIKHIVEEMYGAEKNYDWSQASVTEYFRTGKRNCDSIDRAEQIVFEGVIERLPESERSKFELGETAEKQHVIATLMDRRSARPVTYLLEPGIKTLEGDKPEVGTVRVDAAFLKKSTVSSEIKAVSAVAGKPGEILPSPDIDVVTDQPIPHGYLITGALKGAEFNYEQAQKEKIEVEPYRDIAQNPMQIEFLNEMAGAEQADKLVDGVLEYSNKIFEPVRINTDEIQQPSGDIIKWLVKRIRENSGYVGGGWMDGFTVSSLKGWKPEAIDRLLHSNVNSIEISPRLQVEEERNLVETILQNANNMTYESDDFGFKQLILNGFDSGRSIHLPTDLFKKLVETFGTKDRAIRIGSSELTDDEWEVLSKSKIKELDVAEVMQFPGSMIGEAPQKRVFTRWMDDEKDTERSGRLLSVLNTSGKDVRVDGAFYLKQALRNREVLKYIHITPDFTNLQRGMLAEFLSGTAVGNDPAFKKYAQQMRLEIERQNAVEAMASAPVPVMNRRER